MTKTSGQVEEKAKTWICLICVSSFHQNRWSEVFDADNSDSRSGGNYHAILIWLGQGLDQAWKINVKSVFHVIIETNLSKMTKKSSKFVY